MLPLDWEAMPYFLAVARKGTLRGGAEALNANHVTVRRNIEALEASYGVRLFNRSRQGFELTEAGEALVPLAEEAEQSFLGARRRVEGLDKTETGTIRFSLPPMLAFDVVAPILTRFIKAYPGIDLDLHLTDVKEDINRAETDVSLRVAFEVSDDVVARRLYPITIGTYAHKSYIENEIAQAGPGGVGLEWIGWTGSTENPAWIKQSPFPNASVRHGSDEGFMHLSLLRNGYGISKLPAVFEDLYPELSQVPGTEYEQSRTLWVLLHSDMRRTVRVRRFVDFLVAELKALQPQMQGQFYS